MIFKCSNCDSALEFDPATGKMKCRHCGSFFPIAEEEDDAEEYNPDVDPLDETDYKTVEVKIYTCTSCGAELAVNDTEVTTWCAFCGQPTVVYSRVSNEQKPKYIIPFRITGEQVVNAIREQFSQRLFIPRAVKKFKVDQIRGIYVPYYLFDVYYHDLEFVDAWENQVYYKYMVEAECEFKQLSCDATKRLTDESSQRLEPFDFRMLKSFHPAYLSGFYADRNDLSARLLSNVAISRCRKMYNLEVKRVVRDFNATIRESNPDYKIRKADYALLPVWFMTFRYGKNLYTILVNGQNGKVVGGVPLAKGKIWAMYLGILLVISPLVAGIFILLYLSFGGAITIFAIVASVLAIILHIAGFGFINTYLDNLDMTMNERTARFVKERKDKES